MPKASKQTSTRDKSVLTDKQLVAANATLDNVPMPGRHTMTQAPKVQDFIKFHREELSSHLQIKRADVIAGMQEAIEMAKLAADPSSMIRGWSEIAKMLGLYAPEVKKLEVSATSRNIISKYEAMTDEELLSIVEGECTHVEVSH